MSCLNLKFPPARTTWKIFAAKIRRKLRILSPPKKKSVHVAGRSRLHGGVGRRPLFKRKRQRRSPVFIDELFRRPVQDGTVLEHGGEAVPAKYGMSRSIKVVEWPVDVRAAETTGAEAGEGGESTTAAAGDDMWESVAMASPLMQRIDERAAETTGAEAGEGGESTTVAAGDDMWESVAMASPLMQRIDERAEEFIAKFRANMVHQEMVAGDL
ncbi:hypothetical protein MLD38_028051 [Melastoma candidum]|uniref:Uncharacterized protein n=1 Tax=Melastoma candidum TaxID=119954 RepID=A0ACB9MZR5_9MYRT|nr:hypothetical protein MLD38_028051 [Melastoma candidum]